MLLDLLHLKTLLFLHVHHLLARLGQNMGGLQFQVGWGVAGADEGREVVGYILIGEEAFVVAMFVFWKGLHFHGWWLWADGITLFLLVIITI